MHRLKERLTELRLRMGYELDRRLPGKPGARRWQFGTKADDHTHPIVLTNRRTRRLYMVATSPTSGSPKSIYYKETSLDAPSFDAGTGTPLIADASTAINNPTSTKQDLSSAPSLLVLASDATSYWFNTIPAPAPPPPPADSTAPGLGPIVRPITFRATLRGPSIAASGGTGVSYRCPSPRP